jgi:hypothetical protein
MLTPAQIAHFRTFGFVILRQVYDAAETVDIRNLLDEQLAMEREGKPYDTRGRQLMLGFMESRPELMDLLEDDRLYGPLAQLLGEDFIFSGSDGNWYSGDTPWHPDSGTDLLDVDYRRIKVAMYLDPLTAATGALRIIPGSHRAPLFHELWQARRDDAGRDRNEGWIEERYGVTASQMPAVALESMPGDVVMFDTHCWHASFGGRPGRRMIAISYGQKPTRKEHDDFLKTVYDFNMSCIKSSPYRKRDWMYGEPFLRSERPRIRRMSSRLVELGLR